MPKLDRILATAIIDSIKKHPEEWSKGSSGEENFLKHVRGQKVTYFLGRTYGDRVYFDPWFDCSKADNQKIANAIKGWFQWQDNLPENVTRRENLAREQDDELRKRIESLTPAPPAL